MSHSHNRFSKNASAEYDEVAVIARLIGDSMVTRLQLVTLQPKTIVEMGNGTRQDAVLLQQQFPEAQILPESLSLPDHSVDLIFANLLLPWCNDWSLIFAEWRRLLRPEGLCVFSCFGPDTLKEIVNHGLFLKDMHEIGDALVHTRFSDPVMDVEYVTLKYSDQQKMLTELQICGVNAGTAASLSLTYEIIHGHIWGPDIAVDNMMDQEGIVRIPLSQLRRRKVFTET